MAERRGMGRGLSAILPAQPAQSASSPETDASDALREVPVEAIVANPQQPRQQFDEEALQALADSIAHNGVLQPLLVRPLPAGRYELVAGERRLRAATIAGVKTVPAYVRAGIEPNTLELALIENMARVDLNPIEEARACATLVEDLGLTKEDVAKRVGKSRVAVSNLIRLLNLPDEVIGLIESGQLSEGHGRALLRATDHFTRRRLAHQALDLHWSVRETERQAELADGIANPDAKPYAETSGKPSELHSAAEADAFATELADRWTTLTAAGTKVKAGSKSVTVTLKFATPQAATDAIDSLERGRP